MDTTTFPSPRAPTTATSKPPIPTPAPATSTAAADNPWPAIEHNHFTFLRELRKKEDDALEADFEIKSGALRRQLIDNYEAQRELQRKLQVLRDEYEARRAALEGLEGEVQSVRAQRRVEREREDEEKRAWFERFRRGGLAYREREGGSFASDADAVEVGEQEEYGDKREREHYERWGEEGGVRVGVEEGGLPGGESAPEPPLPSESEMEEGTSMDSGVFDESLEQQEETAGLEVDEAHGPVLADEAPRRVEKIENLQSPGKVDGAPRGQIFADETPRQPEEIDGQQPAEKDDGAPQGRPFARENQDADPGQTESVDVENGVPHNHPAEEDEPAESRDEQPADVEMEDRSDDAPANPQGEDQPRTAETEMTDTEGPVTGLHDKDAGEEQAAGAQEREPDTTSPADEEPQAMELDVPDPGTLANGEEHGETLKEKGEVLEPGHDGAESVPVEGGEEMDGVKVNGNPNTHDNIDGQEAVNIERQEADRQPVNEPPRPDQEASNFEPSANHQENRDQEIQQTVPEAQLHADVETAGAAGEEDIEAPDVQAPADIGSKDDEPPRSPSQAAHAIEEAAAATTAPLSPSSSSELSSRHTTPELETPISLRNEVSFPATPDGATAPAASPAESPAKSATKARVSGGSFTAVNNPAANQTGKEKAKDEGGGKAANAGTPRKGPRKSLPTTRKALPETPSAGSAQPEAENLPEINKAVLCLRDDGVVYTDPPIMRGVPLAKISPDHPYWEPGWKPVQDIVEPLRQKHQEKFEQLEKAGSTHRDKHLANRDAKRGRTILKWLEDGDLHPYQLVGKDFINYRITNYDTLFRLAHLLTEELPKMDLDITPAEWLRHRIHELYVEKGDKFDVAGWVAKAYHDRKIEQLRNKNGFARVGRPPAHASKNTEPGYSSSNRKATAPRSLKRKDPHQTPDFTPSKPRAAAADAPGASAPATAPAQQRPKKIRIITSRASTEGQASPEKKPKITLNSPFPPSATTDDNGAADEARLDTALEYDGYTSSDSTSGDQTWSNDWRLHQVKTRSFATNTGVTQYWHWVEEKKGHNFVEHQVLESVHPVKWSIFKKPYNFHLKLGDISEVTFARGSTKVVVSHKKGRDGRDMGPRGDVLAMFKRERTKRRFLTFMGKEKGVRLVEATREFVEAMWNSCTPETLNGPDSD